MNLMRMYKPFRMLVPVWFLSSLGISTLSTMIPFYVHYILRPTNWTQWLGRW